MRLLVLATVIIWALTLWLGVGVLRVRGVVHRLKRLVAALGCGMVGIGLTALVVLLHSFQMFAGETLVARVSTARLSPEEFELTYVPVRGAQPQRVRLRGDQWSVGGGVVKWHPWLTMFGVPSYHKPLRLSGQFSRLERQRAQPPTVEVLDPTGDRVWETLYRVSPWLPFIDAVYGSCAYVYVEPAVTQEIYVTISGYLIKRASSHTTY